MTGIYQDCCQEYPKNVYAKPEESKLRHNEYIHDIRINKTKSWTYGNCGLRKEVTASRKKVTRCARHRRKVQNKEKVAQRNPTRIDVGKARNAVSK
jgi:hypothetical protein